MKTKPNSWWLSRFLWQERNQRQPLDNFERVDSCKYLGWLVNTNNKTSEEIKRRVNLTNTAYYELYKQFRSRNI